MWVVLAIIVAPIVWAILTYNRLVALKNQVANGWRQIDVQLKRRHDLIPNLVAAVRGYMEHERTTLERVIAARNQAAGATTVAERNAAEADLSRTLRQLFAVAENYPQLRASERCRTPGLLLACWGVCKEPSSICRGYCCRTGAV